MGVAVTVEVWDVGLSSRCSFLKWALFKRKHHLIQRKFHQIKLCRKFIMRGGDIMTATARRWDRNSVVSCSNSQVLLIQSMNQSNEDRPSNIEVTNQSINGRPTAEHCTPFCSERFAKTVPTTRPVQSASAASHNISFYAIAAPQSVSVCAIFGCVSSVEP